MRSILLFLSFLIVSATTLKAQEYAFRNNIDKDSLFRASIVGFPKQIQKKYTKIYKSESEKGREFLIFMISMPKSDKKVLVDNYENKKDEINKLKDQYSKIVPKNYVVYIEFEPTSKVLMISDNITIKIYRFKNANNSLGVIMLCRSAIT
jgi:hypothetical protein